MRRVKNFMPLLGLVVVLALAGCGAADRADRFKTFKDSTAALEQGVGQTYEGIAELQTKVDAMHQARKDSMFGETPETYLGAYLKGKEEKDAKRKRLAEIAAQQRHSIAVVSQYAVLLHSLASEDYAAKLEDPALKLGAGLKSLGETLDPSLKGSLDVPLGLLSTLVFECGRLAIETERVKRLRSAMDKGQPYLDALPILFGDNSTGPLGENASNRANDYLGQCVWFRPQGRLERIAFDAEVEKTMEGYLAVWAGLGKIQSSATGLGKAHKALRTGLDGRKPETEQEKQEAQMQDLKAFLVEVQKLVALYNKTQKTSN
jgi:hypothetical protein